MGTILAAETVHPGGIHAMVNSAFLCLLQYAFPEHRLIFMAEKGHIKAIQDLIPDGQPPVCCKSFRHKFVSRRGYWPYKIIGEWIRILRVIRQARLTKPALLVWTALFPTGHWLLRLLTPLLLKRQQQLIVLHGELEYFNIQPKITGRMLRICLKKGLEGSGAETRYIVFSDHIRDELSRLNLRSVQRMFVLPHPYHYTRTTTAPRQTERTEPKPVVAGTFGSLQPHKNVSLLFDLAHALRDRVSRKDISFHAAGLCPPEVRALNVEQLVTLHEPDRFLPQPDFERVISRFDLALFFYDDTAYRLCASGVIHEAIRMGIPVLALENAYFTWCMEHAYVGKLFRNISDMEQYIRELLDGKHRDELEKIRHDIDRFRQDNTLIKQAQRLKHIIGPSVT